MKKEGKSKRKRLSGGGRKALDEEMEDGLFNWIIELNGRNLRVSREMIRQQAKTLSTTESFKASRGWLDGFMKRKQLSLRRKTTVCQTAPADCISKLVNFTYIYIHIHVYVHTQCCRTDLQMKMRHHLVQ